MTEPGEGRREAVAKILHEIDVEEMGDRIAHEWDDLHDADRYGYRVNADRIIDLLAALEGAEPVAWKWKCILGHAGIDTWSPTSCPLCRFQGRIVECEPLYRHPPEHGTGRDLLRAVRNLCRDRGYAGPPIIELIKQLVRGEREAISEVGEAVICGHLDNLSNAHQTNLSLLLHRTDRQGEEDD